jgi:hypothetical protein
MTWDTKLVRPRAQIRGAIFRIVVCGMRSSIRTTPVTLDILHRLAQVVEDGRSAIEQGAAVGSRLYTLGVAVEQTHAYGSLQFRARFGDSWLSRIEDPSRWPGRHHPAPFN